MCGLFCYIAKNNKIDRTIVEKATHLVKHRGPDSKGFYYYDNVGLGHRRLSVFDLNKESDQPMTREKVTIIYNGAVYNFKELRKELESANIVFTTNSDTEVVLQSYRHWGYSCLHKFNGMWAFLILDEKKEIIWAARDRFGIKPLYYLQTHKGFCLASEPKQFTAIPEWTIEENKNIAKDYLNYGLLDHTEHSFFSGVKKLSPGYEMTYSLEKHVFISKSYYNLQEKVRDIKSADAESLLKESLDQSILLRLQSDVSLGSCLSGGLDSSAILARIGSIQNLSNFNTFSITYPDFSTIDETPFIQSLLERYNFINKKVIPSISNISDKIFSTVWHQDEPFPLPSVVTQFMLFEKARDTNIKVMLDGQGADEILGGYEQFYLPLIKEHPEQMVFILHHLCMHHKGYLRRYLSSFIHRFKKLSNTAKEEYLFKNQSSLSPFQNTSFNLIFGMGLQALLRFEDRNSMAHGIEARCPYLDHNLVEVALSIPSKVKITRGIRKNVLRETMKNSLPGKVLLRYKKLGFDAPLDRWREELLGDPSLSKNFDIDIKSFYKSTERNTSPLFFRKLLYNLWKVKFSID